MYKTKVSQIVFSSLICGSVLQSMLSADGILPENAVVSVDTAPKEEKPPFVILPVITRGQQAEPASPEVVQVVNSNPREANPPSDIQIAEIAPAPTVAPKTANPPPENGDMMGVHASPVQPQTTPAPVQNPPKKKRRVYTTHPNRLNIRHIEGGGIGYNKGYTTVEGFFMPFKTIDRWLPFLDVRGHRFDDGKYALNAGLGFRFLAPSHCTIWGFNAYYDYRQSHHKNFQHVGVGVEALGKRWDFRLNGYIPVSARISKHYQTHFHHFKGNNLILQTKYKFDLVGANAEGAYHWRPKRYLDITGALGPYYLQGKFGEFAAGGQARLKLTFKKCISLEGIGSYDNLFKWRGQGQLAFSIPLGPKVRNKGVSESGCRCVPSLSDRFAQPVQRFEIIPVSTHKKHFKAINPVTEDPYNFVFVDNDPPQAPDGTFEEPFLTLPDADLASLPGDIVYVFGSNIPYMPTMIGDTIFTMKDGQRLWGSGVNHHLQTTMGNIVIPPQTALHPELQNGAQAQNSIIVMGNNTEISGLSFPAIDVEAQLNIAAIEAVGVSNITIDRNNFVMDSTGLLSQGVYVQDCGGLIHIRNNTILDNDTVNDIGFGFNMKAPLPNTVIIVENNTLFGDGVFSGIDFRRSASTSNPLQFIVRNNFINNWGYGVLAQMDSNAGDSIQILNNTFTECVTDPVRFQNQAPGNTFFSVNANTFKESGASLIECTAGGSAVVQINNNSFAQSTGAVSLRVQTDATSTMCLQINNNIFDKPATVTGTLTGVLSIEPPTGNEGDITTNTVTNVPQGTCQ